MVERLLIAFRAILTRKPGLDRDIVRAIDARLLSLPKDSGKIGTERHWELWADAVAALRSRGSFKIGAYIRRRLKSEKDPRVRDALSSAAVGLTGR